MLPGISTACLYPLETEKALRLLAEQGVAATEVFINTASELERPYTRELKRIAEAGGVKILSVHPFTSGIEPILFFSQYERRFQDGRELYKRYYEAAAELGAGIFVFHGGLSEFSIEPERFMDRLRILMRDAEREEVRLCHENVTRNIGRDPAFFVELAAAVPEAGFVFDVKQAIRSGHDGIGFAKAMGERIAHVHLRDHDDTNDCLPPGKGGFDLAGFLAYLRGLHYKGGVLIELYRQGYDDYEELFKSYRYLEEIIG
jgi:sugar phosphate isomerase/epimerase